jgi:hypothetical protein
MLKKKKKSSTNELQNFKCCFFQIKLFLLKYYIFLFAVNLIS